MSDAARHRHADPVVKQRLARAVASVARLGPGLAATAAPQTHPANRHLDRHDETAAGLTNRQRQLRPHNPIIAALAEERVPHAFDDVTHVGKVDGDLVREAVVQHRWLANDRGRFPPCQGSRRMLTSDKNHA